MAIKIIHTADWHLGKKLYGRCRQLEHQAFCQWLHQEIIDQSIDILIISGDIFDTPNPPYQSLKLFYDFISKIQKETKCNIYAIAGNHDSAQLLEAANPLIDKKRCIIQGPIDSRDLNKHFFKIEKNDCQLFLCLFPFFRHLDLEKVKNQNSKDQANGSNDLAPIEIFFQCFQQFVEANNCDQKAARILVAHHLFGSFMPSGSEQGLVLSGVETIPISLTAKYFDYCALGHIHRPQVLKHESPTVVYPGSPFAMRFSELSTKQEKRSKQVRILTLDKEKKIDHHALYLPEFRPMISIEGHFLNINEKNFYASHFIKEAKKLLEEKLEDIKEQNYITPIFLEVKIWCQTPQADLDQQFKEFLKDHFKKDYPNLEILNFQVMIQDNPHHNTQREKDLFTDRGISTEELFEKYYLQNFGDLDKIPQDIKHEFQNVLKKVRGHHQENNQINDITDGASL